MPPTSQELQRQIDEQLRTIQENNRKDLEVYEEFEKEKELARIANEWINSWKNKNKENIRVFIQMLVEKRLEGKPNTLENLRDISCRDESCASL